MSHDPQGNRSNEGVEGIESAKETVRQRNTEAVQELETALLDEKITLTIIGPLRRGDSCPVCGEGRLDYDDLLNLSCPLCSFALAGGCT